MVTTWRKHCGVGYFANDLISNSPDNLEWSVA
jgi:hypothetical protein